MKLCTACRRTLPLDSFHIHRRDQFQSKCKDCAREFSRQHYHANKQKYRDKARRWDRRTAEFIAAAKAAPCADCGKNYPPYCMDFDHLPGVEKSFGLANGTNVGKPKIEAEMAKCEVVCAVCHRIRTHERRKSRL